MNKERRSKLSQAINILYQAIDSINDGTADSSLEILENAEKVVQKCMYEEEECMDVIPENLQFSPRYERMQEAYDAMDDAITAIQDAIGYFHDAVIEEGVFLDGDLRDNVIERIEEAISSVEDAQVA